MKNFTDPFRQKLLDIIDEMENKQYDADTILTAVVSVVQDKDRADKTYNWWGVF